MEGRSGQREVGFVWSNFLPHQIRAVLLCVYRPPQIPFTSVPPCRKFFFFFLEGSCLVFVGTSPTSHPPWNYGVPMLRYAPLKVLRAISECPLVRMFRVFSPVEFYSLHFPWYPPKICLVFSTLDRAPSTPQGLPPFASDFYGRCVKHVAAPYSWLFTLVTPCTSFPFLGCDPLAETHPAPFGRCVTNPP